MSDFVSAWITTLKTLGFSREINEPDECSLGYHLSEYWHVSYNPDTKTSEIKFECYPYWIPESFRVTAKQLATEWFNKLFDSWKTAVIELLSEVHSKDIEAEYVMLPSWTYKYTKLEFFLGMPVKYREDYRNIGIESPKFCFSVNAEMTSTECAG